MLYIYGYKYIYILAEHISAECVYIYIYIYRCVYLQICSVVHTYWYTRVQEGRAAPRGQGPNKRSTARATSQVPYKSMSINNIWCVFFHYIYLIWLFALDSECRRVLKRMSMKLSSTELCFLLWMFFCIVYQLYCTCCWILLIPSEALAFCAWPPSLVV